METTFLSTLADLEQAETFQERLSHTTALSDAMAEDRTYARTVARAATSLIVEDLRHTYGEFMEERAEPYVDEDGLTKVAFGLAILQDHNEIDLTLEQTILDLLETEIRNRRLELLVNDLTVNGKQRRIK